MERDHVIAVSLAVVLLTVLTSHPIFGQGGAPSEVEMIKQRLQSDLDNLRQKNKKLREKIERLKREQSSVTSGTNAPELEALRAENRRLRKLVNRYRTVVNQFVKKIKKTDTSLEMVSVPPQESTVTAPSEDESDTKGKWIDSPDRPYPIRRKPLQKEITYVTDADDTLSKIAHQFYHDAALWIRVYLVNEQKLESPDALPPGTKLRLPPFDRIKQE